MRPLLALSFAALAFWALAASDPGVLFFAKVSGKSQLLWNPDNHFATDQREVTVIVRQARRHSSLRAHFSVCPLDHPECRAGGFFRLPIPDTGQITLRFPQAPVAMDLQRAPLHPLYVLFLALLALAFGILFTGDTRLLALLSLAASGLLFSVTMGQWRALDVNGHLAHVELIAQRGPFVNANICWECFHPPLYYSLASAFLGFPTQLSSAAATLLQGLAIALHALAAPLVLAALRPFSGSRRDLFLYSALVALWPAGVLASVRVGNDGLLDLCAFAVLALLARERFVGAACVAGLAIFIKKSAALWIAFTVCWALWRRPREGLLCLGIGCAALALGFGVDRIKEFDPARLAALSGQMYVANTAENLLLPAPRAFFAEPYVNPWEKSPGRDHLVNYFWKSSLFGEWGYDVPGWAPTGLSVLLVLLLAVAAWSWWRGGREWRVLGALGIAFSAVVAYRALYPFACNADFRFVYPLVAWALAVSLARESGPAERWATGVFLLLSQSFFVLIWIAEAT